MPMLVQPLNCQFRWFLVVYRDRQWCGVFMSVDRNCVDGGVVQGDPRERITAFTSDHDLELLVVGRSTVRSFTTLLIDHPPLLLALSTLLFFH